MSFCVLTFVLFVSHFLWSEVFFSFPCKLWNVWTDRTHWEWFPRHFSSLLNILLQIQGENSVTAELAVCRVLSSCATLPYPAARLGLAHILFSIKRSVSFIRITFLWFFFQCCCYAWLEDTFFFFVLWVYVQLCWITSHCRFTRAQTNEELLALRSCQ